MEDHVIDIELLPNGEVKVHVQGVKGKRCMKYVDFLKSLVGEVKQTTLTHEFYEPDTRARIELGEEQQVRNHGG